MSYSLSTIRRGLRNLFTKRVLDLEASNAGAYFKPVLHTQYVAITDLPVSLTGAPFKDDLRFTDVRHDAFGKVIYLVTEACFECPDVAPNLVEAAKQVREAFVPALDELNAPYATEGERALDHRALLTSLAPQLKMFALPWDANKSLLDVATSFVNEGEKLDDLLNQRANEPKALRTRAGVLRSKTLGALNRLRKDLVQEVEQNALLPRDLVHRVFGFFDTLHAMEAAGRGHEKVEGEDDVATGSVEAAQPG